MVKTDLTNRRCEDGNSQSQQRLKQKHRELVELVFFICMTEQHMFPEIRRNRKEAKKDGISSLQRQKVIFARRSETNLRERDILAKGSRLMGVETSEIDAGHELVKLTLYV